MCILRETLHVHAETCSCNVCPVIIGWKVVEYVLLNVSFIIASEESTDPLCLLSKYREAENSHCERSNDAEASREMCEIGKAIYGRLCKRAIDEQSIVMANKGETDDCYCCWDILRMPSACSGQ